MIHFISPIDTPTRLSYKDSNPTPLTLPRIKRKTKPIKLQKAVVLIRITDVLILSRNQKGKKSNFLTKYATTFKTNILSSGLQCSSQGYECSKFFKRERIYSLPSERIY